MVVGIVVVSHSSKIAEGLKELMEQVAQSRVPIAAAGGTTDGRLGTDAIAISQAIQSVFSPAGVLVLVDMGSAVLSAETAVSLLEPEMTERVILCQAPLVEGGLMAAVQASIGMSLDDVRQAAESAASMSKF